MLRVGIDARLYNQTGVGVYLRNLLYFLEKIRDGKILFYLYLLPEDYNKVKFRNKYFIKKSINFRWHTFSEQIKFAWSLYKDNLDLVHFTYFSYPVLYRKKFIATVHDTTPLTFKTGKASTKNRLLYEFKFRAFHFVISQQVKNAIKVITPSQTVKRQLVELYGKKYENKIVPIYEGVDYELIEMYRRHPELGSGFDSHSPAKRGNLLNRSVPAKAGIRSGMKKDKSFFIYVGNFYPHKNVERLIRAFAKVRSDVGLVLIGPDDFFTQRLIQLIDKLNQQGRIVFFHNPSKAELVFFYNNALALIHPSLSEGFGLPIVEAAYFNLPIIASKIPIFEEILRDNFTSFDPKSTIQITHKIEEFLKEKRKINIKESLRNFTFEKMAKQTFDLYRSVLKMPKEDIR